MNANDLLTLIRNMSRDCLSNEGLTDLIYGTYQSEGIKIDDRPLTIPLDMVDIPRRLTDYTVSAEIGGVEQSIKIKNKLSAGERVVMVQKHGGQRYAIIDRVG